MIKKVAIIGATGVLGKPVTVEISKAQFTVTALVRDISKAKELLPRSVQLINGKLENKDDLELLLRDQDALYLNLNLNPKLNPKVFHPEREGLQLILSAAKKSSIQRIAIVSSLVMNYHRMNGFHWWAFDIKEGAIKMIKACGIPYTIFYPSSFFENFISHYRQGNRIILAGKSLYKQWFISAEDYGKQVATSLKRDDHENHEYSIQGLEGFTSDEAAKIFVTNANEKLNIVNTPLGIVKFFGLFSNQAAYGANIITAINNYPEQFQSQKTWNELGKPSLTLEQFASQQVSARQ
jgi:uncharacterized protein YbjT (DUF2867 family)